jgi:hypothetical protein
LISSEAEYQKARDELEYLTRWLARLEGKEATERKGLTTASIRNMISRVQEEIAQYEAENVSTPPRPESGAEPGDPGVERRTKGRN